MMADIALREYRRVVAESMRDPRFTLEEVATMLRLTALCERKKVYVPVVCNIFNFPMIIS